MEWGIAAMGWHVRPAMGDYVVALLWAPAFTFVVFSAQNRAVTAIAAAHGGVDIDAAVHAHSLSRARQSVVGSSGFDLRPVAPAPKRSWRLAKRAVEVRAILPGDEPPATDAAQGPGSRLFQATRQARQQELLLC